MNQLRKCRLNESEESPQNTCEEPIDAIFDHFDLDTPQVSPEVQHSGRKRKFTQPLDVNQQEAEVLIVLLFLPFFQEEKERKILEGGGGCETETYLHHELFQHYITSFGIS